MGELLFFILDVCLLGLAAFTAIAVIEVRSLFASSMLAGFYSLIMALIWQNMDAVDVSFTEAAVGAGISTILLLGTVAIVGRDERPAKRVNWPALGVVTLTGAALIYGTFDMPRFGDPQAPIHTLRVPNILEQRVGKVHPLSADEQPAWAGEEQRWGRPPVESHGDDHAHADDHAHEGHAAHPQDDWHGHVPNTVTSLLAGYRSFDTMFETAVIFTAGIGMVLLLRRRDEDDPQPEAVDGRGEGDGEGAAT